jgi:choline dehydrogenase-like flavoprotein
MNRYEYRQLKSTKSQGFLDFKSYAEEQGLMRHIALLVLLNTSFIKYLNWVPILSGLTKSVQGLLLGYLVESEIPPSRNEQIEYTDVTSINFSNNLRLNEDFDYIIIGSGPGAAIAAQGLNPNSRILVIEQGGYPKTPPSKHHTLEHVRNDFYKGGQEIAISSWLPQFAQASVLGGGSEVNSGLYHDLPEHLIDDFLLASSLSQKDYLSSQEKVKSLLQISLMKVDPVNSPIARGAQALGLEFQNIPRWRTYKSDSEFIQHGMIDVVWNRLSQQSNFRFMLNTRVLRINVKDKKLVKVACVDSAGNSVEYSAENLIVAAGAIQSPRLLCESGLVHWRSTRFQWHPMVRAIITTSATDLGLHDVDPFQAWTDDRTFKFGSAVSTPGLLAMNLVRKPELSELPRIRSLYGSFVSTGKGGLIPRTGVPYYFPSNLDREHIKEIRTLVERLVLASGSDFANENQKTKKGVSTVHVFGTLPIDSGIYVSGTSRLKADPRVQVCDGSLLPFGPGVNPQGVIMSLCDALVTR